MHWLLWMHIMQAFGCCAGGTPYSSVFMNASELEGAYADFYWKAASLSSLPCSGKKDTRDLNKGKLGDTQKNILERQEYQ